jgi:RES domain-containing protein
LISILALGYLIYLLKRSNERTGRVVMVALWLIATLACLLLDTSLLGFLLVQAALIWVVRSLYVHASVLPALLDLGLVAIALVASAWAILQTDSVITAIWCFFLTQSLFVLIPGFASTHDNASCFNPVEADRFQSAHRVALDAVRKLSTH